MLAKLQKQKAPLVAGLAYDLYKDKKRQAPACMRAITDISVLVIAMVRFIQQRFMASLLGSSPNRARKVLSVHMYRLSKAGGSTQDLKHEIK